MGQIAKLRSSIDEVDFFNCGLACDYYETESGPIKEVEEGEFGDAFGSGTGSGKERAVLPELGELISLLFVRRIGKSV